MSKDGFGHFTVTLLDHKAHDFICPTDLTVENLQAAIEKIEGIVYAQ
jgi:hypothetical protein